MFPIVSKKKLDRRVGGCCLPNAIFFSDFWIFLT